MRSSSSSIVKDFMKRGAGGLTDTCTSCKDCILQENSTLHHAPLVASAFCGSSAAMGSCPRRRKEWDSTYAGKNVVQISCTTERHALQGSRLSGSQSNIGALIITYTILGTPYYKYSIMYLKTLIILIINAPHSSSVLLA